MSKSDSSPSILSLPKGGGAIRGMGEKFSPDLHTGTGNFTVPIALPPGRNGFQPQLNLAYSTGRGNGPFGLGWSLSVPGIARKTSKGIPRYRDGSVKVDDRDTFILSGAEDLVFVGSVTDENGTATEKYQPRTEGLFAEIYRYRNSASGTDFWRVRTKDGLVSYYGTNTGASEHPAYPVGTTDERGRAIVVKPNRSSDIFAWRLTLTRDPFGNRIEYLYDFDAGQRAGHEWKQLRLVETRTANQIRKARIVGPEVGGQGDPAAADSRPENWHIFHTIRAERHHNWQYLLFHLDRLQQLAPNFHALSSAVNAPKRSCTAPIPPSFPDTAELQSGSIRPAERMPPPGLSTFRSSTTRHYSLNGGRIYRIHQSFPCPRAFIITRGWNSTFAGLFN